MSLRDTSWLYDTFTSAVDTGNANVTSRTTQYNTINIRRGRWNFVYKQTVSEKQLEWVGVTLSAAEAFVTGRVADTSDTYTYSHSEKNRILGEYVVTTSRKEVGPMVFDTYTLD